MGEFEEAGCQVVVVARGTIESGLKWLENVKLPFPLLLDISLTLYRSLGLKRSVKAVWTIPTIVSYAEEKVAGVPSTPAYEGDDLHVLGGDFIVDPTGKLLYAYPSKTSSDRPSLDDVLTVLENLKT